MEGIGTGESAVAPSAEQIDESGPSLTINEFCAVEHISRPTYFAMQRRGVGPEVLRIPGTRVIRITPAARQAWHDRLAQLADEEAGKLERQRRVDQGSRAGKAAVKSPAHVSHRGRA